MDPTISAYLRSHTLPHIVLRNHVDYALLNGAYSDPYDPVIMRVAHKAHRLVRDPQAFQRTKLESLRSGRTGSPQLRCLSSPPSMRDVPPAPCTYKYSRNFRCFDIHLREIVPCSPLRPARNAQPPNQLTNIAVYACDPPRSLGTSSGGEFYSSDL